MEKTLQDILRGSIKYYRNLFGISQAALAEKCKLSEGMIAKIEAGFASPSLQTIEKISHAFQIEPYQLFLTSEQRYADNELIIDSFVSDMRVFLKKRIQE